MFCALLACAISAYELWGLRPVASEDAATVAEKLASEVRRQWEREAAIRLLSQPAPIAVRWSLTGRPVRAMAVAVTGSDLSEDRYLWLDGDVADISVVFRQMPSLHLLILGEPGAGKTVLSMLLLLDLLAHREANDPVPVMLSLSSWHPGIPIGVWIRQRLVEDHPFLARLPVDNLSQLISNGRILPILDGLDELPRDVRVTAVEAIDRAIPRGRPIVVTSRSEEYEELVIETGSHLTRAAVVEIEPVGVRAALEFLRSAQIEDQDRWHSVETYLTGNANDPLAQVLSTPLMLFLLRAVYSSPASNPTELLDRSRFPDRLSLEEHLLDGMIPAVYAQANHRRYTPTQAGRWLSFIATRMGHRRSRDLSWWYLESPIAALAIGLVFGSAIYLLMDQFPWPNVNAPRDFGVITGIASWMAVICTRQKQVDDPGLGSPRSLLRRHRNEAVLLSMLVGTGIGLLIISLFDGVNSNPGPARIRAIAFACMVGLGVGLCTRWGSFLLSYLWYALTRRLPLRPTRFFENAHQAGILRQVGTLYQFRHALLQDRLGGAPRAPRWRSRRSKNAGNESREKDSKFFSASFLVRVAVPAAILCLAVVGLAANDTDLTPVPGMKPDGVFDTYDCSGFDEPCDILPTFYWILPPGSQKISEFRLPAARWRNSFGGITGGADLHTCPHSVIDITVTLDHGRPAGTIRITEPWRFSNGDLFAWLYKYMPREPQTLTLKIRRADSQGCTARLNMIVKAVYPVGF
jgi:NACHT domain